ncbi:MOSC N-terminal beta barrel domain-containing protein [Pigmentiphaga soli]|uniref:MOSC N-terminal beta barrel domain-containing protein n=1 Tax=Pigmentiphaga soli TaxID=1007095 RepID=A0ABP8HQC3_9BURK
MSIGISGLYVYPIKSCAGIALAESGIGAAGLYNDRRWMVVSPDGDFITQRSHPALARVATALHDGYLVALAPGLPRLDIPIDVIEDDDSVRCSVRVWGDVVDAIDEGELAAQWFAQVVGAPCRLVRVHPQARRAVGPARVAAWLASHPDVRGFAAEHVTAFADGYPVLVANEASLRELNERLAAAGAAPVGMERFRPNVVLDEFGAFDEDYTVEIAIGAVRLALVKPCVRCEIPNTDQRTGARGVEPMATLAGFRSQPGGGVTFGMNAIVQAPPGAVVKVGDRAEVRLDFQE